MNKKTEFNKLEIRDSNIEGKGVFATSNFTKGEIICEFRGEKLTIPKLKEKCALGEERIDDALQINNDTYLDLDEPYIFFNHSCNPNAGMRGLGTLFALRDINVGEEILYDYSSTEWTDDRAWGIDWTDQWRIPCRCGAQNCRKEIRVFSLLPQEIKEKYHREGALMDFIIAKF